MDSKRILIVDDDQLDRQNLIHRVHKAYEDTGTRIDIRQAASVEDMHGKLAHSRYDAVFLDVCLTGDDSAGLEVARDLMVSYPNIPLIIITGHYQDKIKQAVDRYWSEARICGILDKLDYQDQDLFDAIEKAFGFAQDKPNEIQQYEPPKAESSLRSLLKLTLEGLTPRLVLPHSGLDDLIHLALYNPADYRVAFGGLQKLNEQQNPTQGARRIYAVDCGVWEKKINGLRIYFQVGDGRAQVLRLTPKDKQDETIEWLKKSQR